MGSVPSLYTTGDNDPELEPEQYYRHYLYCDACGSFDLAAWHGPNAAAFEARKGRLARAALITTTLAMVSAWQTLGLLVSIGFLMVLAAGTAAPMVFWGYGQSIEPTTGRTKDPLWTGVKTLLLWLPAVVAVEWIGSEILAPAIVLAGLLLLLSGLIAAWMSTDSKIEALGMRCQGCGATYPYGSAFFTDLDANPRNLTLTDVPRPLGSTTFSRGASVGRLPL